MKKSKHTSIVVGIAILAVGWIFFGNLFMSLFNQGSTNNTYIMLETGVETVDVVTGTGEAAMPGDTITVHYVGTLVDGRVFDSSRDRGTPFTFTLGGGQVIRGWDEGLVGMKVGGTRQLLIAPDYGYGDRAHGPIPANSTLIFQVELLQVEK